jgi:hypothetical protein
VIGPLVAQGIRPARLVERLTGDHDLLGDRFPNSSVIVRQFERNGLQITLEEPRREPVSLPRFHPLPPNLIEAWLIQDIRRSILRSLERDPWETVSWLADQGVKTYREFRLHKPSPAMRGEAEKPIWRPAVLPAVPFDPQSKKKRRGETATRPGDKFSLENNGDSLFPTQCLPGLHPWRDRSLPCRRRVPACTAPQAGVQINILVTFPVLKSRVSCGQTLAEQSH